MLLNACVIAIASTIVYVRCSPTLSADTTHFTGAQTPCPSESLTSGDVENVGSFIVVTISRRSVFDDIDNDV